VQGSPEFPKAFQNHFTPRKNRQTFSILDEKARLRLAQSRAVLAPQSQSSAEGLEVDFIEKSDPKSEKLFRDATRGLNSREQRADTLSLENWKTGTMG